MADERYRWQLQVDLNIDPIWVADGFNVDDDGANIARAIQEAILQWAYPYEKGVSVKVLSKPPHERIREEQGYVIQEQQE